MGVRFYVNPRLISGEGLILKHCGVETHRSWNWYSPPPEEEFLIPGRGDIIFINPFFGGQNYCLILWMF